MSGTGPPGGSSREWRSRFFREPSHRRHYLLLLAFSVWAIYYGFTSSPQIMNPTLYMLRWLCIGLGAFLSSMAEFLPKDRVTLAGRLRIAGFALLLVFVGLLLLDVALDAVPGRN